jgi:heme exporter protein C
VQRGLRYWYWLVLPLMLTAWYLDLVWSPDEVILGPSIRIFYVHMAAAAVMPVMYLITFVSSIMTLISHDLRWDRWAEASAEQGTFLCAIVLLTGIIWGRAVWGAWWTWDPTLTATLMLWMLFVGYMLVRQWAPSEERRAVYSAMVAILAFADVPVDYIAVRWWRSIHPVVIARSGIHMAPSMLLALVVTVAAVAALSAMFAGTRLCLLRTESIANLVREQIAQEPLRGGLTRKPLP